MKVLIILALAAFTSATPVKRNKRDYDPQYSPLYQSTSLQTNSQQSSSYQSNSQQSTSLQSAVVQPAYQAYQPSYFDPQVYSALVSYYPSQQAAYKAPIQTYNPVQSYTPQEAYPPSQTYTPVQSYTPVQTYTPVQSYQPAQGAASYNAAPRNWQGQRYNADPSYYT